MPFEIFLVAAAGLDSAGWSTTLTGMPAFSSFDTRGYRTVSAREGYRMWSSSYEETIKKNMDLWLLDQISTVRWSEVARAADLGCGTGRTGAWLKSRGVQQVDG